MASLFLNQPQYSPPSFDNTQNPISSATTLSPFPLSNRKPIKLINFPKKQNSSFFVFIVSQFYDHSHNNPMKNCGLFDLEKHFAFYGAYHRSRTNILIHMMFVWPIFLTALLILYFTPPLFATSFSLPVFYLFGVHMALLLNFGLFVAFIYALFYIVLDPKAGSLTAFFCVLCWATSSFLACWLGFSLAWKVVLITQVVCWTGQFIGHGVYEKRAPALLDNLVQAFITAPFFVLLEALQTFFGYEPYPGFHANVQAKIGDEIYKWQEKKQA